MVSVCPLGCSAGFDASPIVLPEGPLLRCRACGQLASQIDDERYWSSMQEFDDPRGTTPDERSVGRRFKLAARRLRRIGALLGKAPQDAQLLDVGCSSGTFLLAARELGFSAHGVEPAPRAAAAARAAGLQVHTGTLEEAELPADCYDAITMFEVIEHLPRPLELMRACHRVLKPGGVLLIGTGNGASWTARAMGARWDYFSIARHGGHISFYSTASMRILAERCGFDVARMETRSVRFHERGEVSLPLYLLGKCACELLSHPARWLGKGHDMLAYLRKRA